MRAVLVISARDNVATALQPLEAGRRIDVNGFTIVAAEPIPVGHKIALQAIPAGAGVFKYGSPIGIASRPIEAGAHVHTQNLASTRGRGDLPAEGTDAEGRIAEPPDMAADTRNSR
jgi:hypothetical protein